MRALGLDVGARRIGVALSDELGLLAGPLTTVSARGPVFAELARIATTSNVELLVIGLPRSLSGAEGPQARTVRAFADRLRPYIRVPIDFWDERYTTAEAERLLIERRLSREERRRRVDAAAAAIMLQDYLEAHRVKAKRRVAPLGSGESKAPF